MIDFGLPRGPQEPLREDFGGHFGSSFLIRGAGRPKTKKMKKINVFFSSGRRFFEQVFDTLLALLRSRGRLNQL